MVIGLRTNSGTLLLLLLSLLLSVVVEVVVVVAVVVEVVTYFMLSTNKYISIFKHLC